VTALGTMLLAAVLLQAGADFEVSAALDRESVQLGECVHLQLDVVGDKAADCEVTRFARAPDLHVERLDSRMFRREDGSGGGPQGVLVTRFRYRLYALAAGTITVPSIEITARGRFKGRSGPLVLEVSEGAPGARDATISAALESAGRCFVHEPVALVVDVGVPAGGLRAPRLHLPWLAEPEGLLRLDVRRAEARTGAELEILVIQLGRDAAFAGTPERDGAGRAHHTAAFHFLPLRSGELGLGPAFLAWGKGTPDDPVRYALCSLPVLSAEELPAAGRPAAFTNAVGVFDVTFEAEPRRVRVGDSLSLRFTIAGRGNNEFVTMPGFPELAGSFRIYGTADEREDGAGWPAFLRRRTFELSPLSTAVDGIPPLEFAYFDPEKERYETVTWKGVPLDVLPGEGGGPPDAAVRKPAVDIETIFEELPSRNKWLHSALHIILAVCALAALVAWLEGRMGWLKAGALTAQRKRALRELRGGIELLRSAQTGAGDALARLIAAFLWERFGLPVADILAGGVETSLRSRGFPEDLAADAARLFERLDAERFSAGNGIGGQGGRGLPAELLDEAVRLAERLEREGPP